MSIGKLFPVQHNSLPDLCFGLLWLPLCVVHHLYKHSVIVSEAYLGAMLWLGDMDTVTQQHKGCEALL